MGHPITRRHLQRYYLFIHLQPFVFRIFSFLLDFFSWSLPFTARSLDFLTFVDVSVCVYLPSQLVYWVGRDFEMDRDTIGVLNGLQNAIFLKKIGKGA